MSPSDLQDSSNSDLSAEARDFEFRFGGIGRLYGHSSLQQLAQAHGLVIGLGGVGSWAAESLVRSGLGTITLVDFDEICLSNTNRQLQALSGSVGKLKIQALAERFLLINPQLKINQIDRAFNSETCSLILDDQPDVVIDAIDRASTKCLLITECKKRRIPLVVTGAAGGRRDPNLIRMLDITEVQHDALLARVRRILRQNHGYPRLELKQKGRKKFDILTVASSERPSFPQSPSCATQETDLNQAEKPIKPEGPLDCQSGYGTASFVTGIFGFMTAGAAINMILKKK